MAAMSQDSDATTLASDAPTLTLPFREVLCPYSEAMPTELDSDSQCEIDSDDLFGSAFASQPQQIPSPEQWSQTVAKADSELEQVEMAGSELEPQQTSAMVSQESQGDSFCAAYMGDASKEDPNFEEKTADVHKDSDATFKEKTGTTGSDANFEVETPDVHKCKRVKDEMNDIASSSVKRA